MTILNGPDKRSALNAFKDAFAQNPDDYYLANFIHHLEFIQNENFQKTKPQLKGAPELTIVLAYPKRTTIYTSGQRMGIFINYFR